MCAARRATSLGAALVAAVALAVGCGGGDEESDPGGDRIALFLTEEKDYRLATVDPDGDDLRVIAGEGDERPVPGLFARPAWAPGGTRIAFAGVVGGDPAGGRADIFVMDADGSDRRQLTGTQDAGHPVWAPNGETLYFSRLGPEDEKPSATIWTIRVDGTELRRLTPAADGRLEEVGAVVARGTDVAIFYTRTTCRGDCSRLESEVRLMEPDGADRLIARDAAEPALSPDGRRIAFVSYRAANGSLSYGDREFAANELYVMDADGGKPRRLTRTRDLNEASPSWSGDGRRIAFQRGKVIDNAEGMSVHQVNEDGSCERAVLADAKLDVWYASPAWRPGTRPGRIDC
jgi:Tol biopolymer transport system component